MMDQLAPESLDPGTYSVFFRAVHSGSPFQGVNMVLSGLTLPDATGNEYARTLPLYLYRM